MTDRQISPRGGRKVILGLIASQRRLGNCELFAKEVSIRCPVEHELQLIRLPSLDIKSCLGCYRCLAEGTCPLNDDLAFLQEKIAAADALIVAAPVYFLGAHASLKAVLDRGFSFYRILENTHRKPTILASTYGISERMGVAPQMMRAFASFLCLDVRADVRLEAALPGEVLTKEKNASAALRASQALFGEKRIPSRGGCPFCHNDIWRRKGNGFVCTLCHGTFSLDGRGTPKPGKAGWGVGKPEFVIAHREWLKGMKDKFLTRRKDALRLTLQYKDVGEWLEP